MVEKGIVNWVVVIEISENILSSRIYFLLKLYGVSYESVNAHKRLRKREIVWFVLLVVSYNSLVMQVLALFMMSFWSYAVRTYSGDESDWQRSGFLNNICVVLRMLIVYLPSMPDIFRWTLIYGSLSAVCSIICSSDVDGLVLVASDSEKSPTMSIFQSFLIVFPHKTNET